MIDDMAHCDMVLRTKERRSCNCNKELRDDEEKNRSAGGQRFVQVLMHLLALVTSVAELLPGPPMETRVTYHACEIRMNSISINCFIVFFAIHFYIARCNNATLLVFASRLHVVLNLIMGHACLDNLTVSP
jgi:hypothetical protein